LFKFILSFEQFSIQFFYFFFTGLNLGLFQVFEILIDISLFFLIVCLSLINQLGQLRRAHGRMHMLKLILQLRAAGELALHLGR